MHQTLNVTTAFSTTLHRITTQGILRFELPAKIKAVLWAFALTGEDYFLFYLPGGYGWLHEEWHRAILSMRGVNSYDEIYSFPLFKKFVSVDHIRDEDLINLKKKFPHDLVRAEEAGVEAQFFFTEEIRKNCFFKRSRCLEEIPQLLSNILNSSFYILFSSTEEASRDTTEMEKSEGTIISERDAFGLDFTAWVYDLFRENLPYSMRGVHPSGAGIKRYVSPSQLDEKELNYLKLQGYLTWLNLLSPQIFGFAPSDYWNFYFTHYLTPWGFSAGVSLLIRGKKWGYFLAGKINSSLHLNLPELDAEIWLKNSWNSLLKIRISLWIQPLKQDFYSKKGSPGGLLEIYLNFPLDKSTTLFINPFVKSEGWVPGNEYLDAVSGIRIGTSFRLNLLKDTL